MTNYLIVKGIPVLPNREQRYPFAALDVGDRFEFGRHEIEDVRSASQYVGKKLGRKFSVRKDRVSGLAFCQRVA